MASIGLFKYSLATIWITSLIKKIYIELTCFFTDNIGIVYCSTSKFTNKN